MKKIFKNINGNDFDLVIEDGKISYIGKTDQEGIDLKDCYLYPGLIDVHTHGCIGYDTMDGGEAIGEMSLFQAKNGVTSWYPTTMTMDMPTIKNVLTSEIPKNSKASNVLGYHMEGPYISPEFKGAQNKDFIKSPDIDEFNSLENIKIVTVAPECEGSMDFIKKCDAVVSLGHTSANYEISKEALKNGAKSLTHTFNAMPPLHHRNPGPIGAAIEENAYVEVICDGTHIHKSVILALYKIFGPERMILISDSMRATGMPDGEYEFGGQRITVKNRLALTPDGAIAGSTSTLLDCVKKAIEFGIPMDDAFSMASKTPATLMGIKKGMLKEGYDADFIILDKDLNIKQVIIGGETL